MKRATYQRFIHISQWLTVAGLGAAMLWNLVGLFSELNWGWVALMLPLPGLLGWSGMLVIPRLRARAIPKYPHAYRLLYSTPAGWDDSRVRQALLTLIRSGVGLDIIWARAGTETGCWLAIAHDEVVLARLVQDVFPDGSLETDPYPAVGEGVVMLHRSKGPVEALPTPAALCQIEGVEGVYFRWQSETSAIVAIWGAGADVTAGQYARPGDLLPGQGQGLLSPPFVGDNPWPALPPFPASEVYSGLSASSRLERLAPGLRVEGNALALVIGRDAERQPVGFTLPDLAGMRLLRIVGQAAEPLVIDLVQQAVQANRPVLLLDGRGVVTTRLARRLLREVATGRVLMCDVDRPAQSRFHLNPLWLPADQRARGEIFSKGWLAWLRELGVTPAGLGQAAYRHTQVAVSLTALVTAQRGLTLDVSGLREALLAPDFLALVDEAVLPEPGFLSNEVWAWWRTEGRTTSSFDMHLRLAHLRDRLSALLELPEYSVLWRAPYLDPLLAVSNGQSLFWRLPDPRRRLPAYITSQLLALNTLLTVWPADQPPLPVFLHELGGVGPWVERLQSFSTARLILSAERACPELAERIKPFPATLKPTALLVSRLAVEDAEQMQTELPDDIRPTDLRGLPPNRLVFRRGDDVCTVDMKGQ
jgi:hypothetical protein